MRGHIHDSICSWRDCLSRGRNIISTQSEKNSVKGAKQTINGEWDFPKGGIEEKDLHLESSILRELKEETGSDRYQIKEQLDNTISFIFDEEFANKTGYVKQETTMFLVEYVGDRSDLTPLDDEIKEAKFFQLQDVSNKLTHKDTKDFFPH